VACFKKRFLKCRKPNIRIRLVLRVINRLTPTFKGWWTLVTLLFQICWQTNLFVTKRILHITACVALVSHFHSLLAALNRVCTHFTVIQDKWIQWFYFPTRAAFAIRATHIHDLCTQLCAQISYDCAVTYLERRKDGQIVAEVCIPKSEFTTDWCKGMRPMCIKLFWIIFVNTASIWNL